MKLTEKLMNEVLPYLGKDIQVPFCRWEVVWQGVLYVQIKTETWMESEAGEVVGGQDKYSGLESVGKKIQKGIMSRGEECSREFLWRLVKGKEKRLSRNKNQNR